MNMKRKMIEAILDQCPYIAIAGETPGLEVGFLINAKNEDGILTLRIGRNPNVLGMPDLELTDQGWSGTLTSRGTRVIVFVPWAAVLAAWVLNEQQEVVTHIAWNADLAARKDRCDALDEAAAAAKRSSHLKLV